MTTSAATPRKLKGLGRGLDNLLGADRPPPTLDLSGQPLPPVMLPVAVLQAGRYQPRTRMDEAALQELSIT